MSLHVPPKFSVVTPNDGFRDVHLSRGLKIPGATDGTNPLYDRTLSVADRIAHGRTFLERYCQRQKFEIDRMVDKGLKAAALTELVSVLKFALEIKNKGPETIAKIDLPVVKALMGMNMVGPDAKIFAGHDIGEAPALPASIIKILKSRCELSNSGKTVADTHRLVLIPAAVDGEATSVNSLRRFDEIVSDGKRSAFWKNQDWYFNEEFANQPTPNSRWVLMYERKAPNTSSMSDSEQIEAIKVYKNHQTVDALGAIGTLVLGYLEHGRRDFCDDWGRTEDRASSGERVRIGRFDTEGLYIYNNDDGFCYSGLGRAVCWRL